MWSGITFQGPVGLMDPRVVRIDRFNAIRLRNTFVEKGWPVEPSAVED